MIIVEGYFDVLSLAQHGIHNTVALLGTQLSAVQLKALFEATQELVFCFDGDQAGRDSAWRALNTCLPWLRVGRCVRFAALPQGNDPDRLIRKENRQGFEQHIAQSSAASVVLFDQLKSHSALDTLEGISQFLSEGQGLIKQLPEGIFKELMHQRLKRHVHRDIFGGLAG